MNKDILLRIKINNKIFLNKVYGRFKKYKSMTKLVLF